MDEVKLTPEREAELKKKHNKPIAELTDDELRETEYIDFIVKRFGPGHSSDELSKMEFPDPVWIADKTIPEGLSILYARPKLGKSYLMLRIASEVSVGVSVLGHFDCQAHEVLYIGLEDNMRRFAERLEKLQALPSENLICRDSWPTGIEGLKGLRYLFKARPKTKLVIVDTLGRMLAGTDFNDYGTTVDLIGEIQREALAHHAAIILVHHSKKGGGSDDVLDKALGSTGITASADCLMHLERKRGAGDAYLQGFGKDCADWEIALKARDEGGYDFIGEGSEYRKSAERLEVIRVLEHEGQPVSPKDVAAMLDKTYGSTKWILSEMTRNGEIRRVSRGLYTLREIE